MKQPVTKAFVSVWLRVKGGKQLSADVQLSDLKLYFTVGNRG